MAARKTASSADALAGQLANLHDPYVGHGPRRYEGVGPMPAEADRPEAYAARIPLKVPADMKRDLVLAHADDGIEVSARIRAMIALWQQGGKFRAEVDKMARTTGRPPQRRT
jgi:hypothetical protein